MRQLVSLLLAATLTAQEPKVDFAREVFPLLEQACSKCHGPEKQKARLRLDARATALRGGKSGPALVPGDAKQSRLYVRITGSDGKKRMPLEREPLSAEQIATIGRWIDQGADWPDGVGAAAREVAPHWAFVPPVRPEPPAAEPKGWVRNPIDAFVLQANGGKPSPEADRRTLLRRVTLDLIGLLPTPEETAAFVADPAPDAYERVVDRLLASPHYGERQAKHWLDGARYADSDGYAIDAPRSHWRWRDWVIDALNRDMPFDQFTIEQLAGDLLPAATASQRLATGFHRNTMKNEEGGVDVEEFRNEAIKDRVNTTASVWLGVTLACAQCHDHKYDPLTQRDYYRMFAFWNDADEHDEVVNAKQKEKVLQLRPRAQPRETRIHEKGDFTRLGAVVTPGLPEVLGTLPAGGRATRLDLARWLVSAANPLTARVQMNRLWQRCFGTGLVATENDFGTQGAAPASRELLDWLATEFVRCGWSHKAMHRLIATSAAYRQAAECDPERRAPWRQARIRIEAEIVRDISLLASGLLVPDVGGKSVYPPIPAGVTSLGQIERKWPASQGKDRYRRGLYTAIWRSTPHPSLTVFDAPSAVESCTKRLLSNTPLQALTLLNDEACVEAAGALAARLAQAPGSDAQRLDLGFAICLARTPSARERELLGGRDWLLVARTLLNIDEFVTRE